MADDVIRLDVWGGDWDLPSVDHDCLTVMAFFKFAGVPVKLNKCNNPIMSPSGTLPVLHHSNKKVAKVSNIMDYLSKQEFISNGTLTSVQKADTAAFCALIEEKLLPALMHTWWIEEETFKDVTRPWYCQATGFPLNFYVPNKMRKNAESAVFVMEQLNPHSVTKEDIEAKIYKDAKECLNNLSYRLGEEEFFFGKEPSVLDAKVFGYLVPLMKAPLKSSKLSNHLRGCDNLFSFCNRIMMRYFPFSQEELEEKRKAEEKKRKMERDAVEFPNKKRDMVLAAVFAVTAMVCYAFASGLVQIQIVPEDTDEYSTDDSYTDNS